VAELRDLAGCRRFSVEDKALLAWSALERAVSTVGCYKSRHFDDPLIHAAVRSLGGWERICEMSERDFDTFLRPQFLKTYAAFARVGVSDEASRPLVGTFERQNSLLGYHRDGDVAEIRTGLPWAGEPEKRLTVKADDKQELLKLKRAV